MRREQVAPVEGTGRGHGKECGGGGTCGAASSSVCPPTPFLELGVCSSRSSCCIRSRMCRLDPNRALLPARLLALPARVTLSGALHASSRPRAWGAAAILSAGAAHRHVCKVAAVALEASLQGEEVQTGEHGLLGMAGEGWHQEACHSPDRHGTQNHAFPMLSCIPLHRVACSPEVC